MNREFIKLIASLLLFGSSGIVASQIHMGSYEIVFLRTGIGSILLGILFLMTKKSRNFWKNKKNSFLLMVSGMGLGGGWIFLHEAYQLVGVGISTLLYYCAPAVVMVLSPLLFREGLNWKKGVGFLAVMAGMILINGQAMQAGSSLWGLFCAIMSALMYVLMLITNKKAESIKGMENATFQLIFAFLTVAVYLVLKNGIRLDIPSGDWAPILMLGLVNTGIGCYMYFSSIGYLPVQTVAVCSYLEPLAAVVLSAVILGEAIGLLQMIGAALILGGAVFAEVKGRN